MSDQANRLRELMKSNPKKTIAKVALTAAPAPKIAGVTLAPETPSAGCASQAPSPASARVLVVTSGKGGVGKTNITVNLALALAKRGKRTVLFDADLGLANVDVILGVSPKATLADVIAGRHELKDVLLTAEHGLMIVPGGSGIHELADLSQEALAGVMHKLQDLEHRTDFILVDTGAGISRGVLNFVLAASDILLVTTPEPTAITDAYGLIKAVDQHNPQAQVQLLINLAESETEARAVAEKLIMVVERFLSVEVKYLSHMEKDPEVGRSVLMQQPFYQAFPYGPSARRINLLANWLTNEDDDEALPAPVPGFFSRVLKFIR